MTIEEWYTPQEVADKLKLSRYSVLCLIREGKLGCIKLSSRTYRISESDIAKYLNDTLIVK
jgi:excisionase family DNA binding protein